ncbi:MAG TPA: sulfur carrier protein ThiS [Rudaea sp.]|nr:sulfur carrier protein ThiS [Rudaea sp.]
MTKIVLNGEPCEVDEGLTVTGLLDASAYAGRRVAVEINREIVPKSQHAQRIVHDGDRIEIVQAMGGG